MLGLVLPDLKYILQGLVHTAGRDYFTDILPQFSRQKVDTASVCRQPSN